MICSSLLCKKRAWLVLVGLSLGAGQNGALAQQEAGSADVSAPAAAAVADPSGGASTVQPQKMSLREFVYRLLLSNKSMRAKRNEQFITATGVDRADSAFQSVASVSASNGRSIQKNTAEEAMVRSDLTQYDKSSKDYSAGLSKLLPTGAKVELKSTLSQFMTNIMSKVQPGQGDNYRSFYGLTVTQPLARDGGFAATRSRVRVAELDTSAAELATRDTESTVAAEAIVAYLDWSLAQQRVLASEEKIQMGERLLEQASALNKQGRLSAADVWEVENSLMRFRAALSEAQQGRKERVNKVRTLLMTTASDLPDHVQASEPLPEFMTPVVSLEQSVRLALERRDDFQMRKVMLDKEGIQVAYASNQTLPRIDLVASYGLNGLELSASKAFEKSAMKDYPTWSVGLQLSIPLGTNQQAKADLMAARVRQEDALLSLKALEVAIYNDIDTSVGLLLSSSDRWAYFSEVAQREQKQLELERKRFQAGRSDMREVLMREERAINARLTLIEQQLSYSKAEALLQVAQGVLLDKFR